MEWPHLGLDVIGTIVQWQAAEGVGTKESGGRRARVRWLKMEGAGLGGCGSGESADGEAVGEELKWFGDIIYTYEGEVYKVEKYQRRFQFWTNAEKYYLKQFLTRTDAEFFLSTTVLK
jgi:hypothetical protein